MDSPHKLSSPSTTKYILSAAISLGQQAFHWGFVPTVIYLGFKKGADAGLFCAHVTFFVLLTFFPLVAGMPPLTWESLLWK